MLGALKERAWRQPQSPSFNKLQRTGRDNNYFAGNYNSASISKYQAQARKENHGGKNRWFISTGVTGYGFRQSSCQKDASKLQSSKPSTQVGRSHSIANSCWCLRRRRRGPKIMNVAYRCTFSVFRMSYAFLRHLRTCNHSSGRGRMSVIVAWETSHLFYHKFAPVLQRELFPLHLALFGTIARAVLSDLSFALHLCIDSLRHTLYIRQHPPACLDCID